MDEKKRVKSIAGKLHLMWTLKLFFIFLVMDIVAAAAVSFCYIYEQERIAFGSFDTKVLIEPSYDEDTKEIALTFDKRHEKPVTVDITSAVSIATRTSIFVVSFEGVIFIFNALFGIFKVRRKLRPLREMAEAASSLSSASLDSLELENLTYAIDHVEPDSETAHVHTNNAELSSIEMSLNNLLDRMRETYKQQTRFVSDASHELRTPIAVIKGYADMLDRWGKEDEQVLEEGIAAIKQESNNMNILVEQLLFLARGDSGRQTMNMETLNLTDIVKEVYEESVMIDEKHAYEYVSEPGEIVSCTGDSAMLKQALRIFTDNAAKYTKEGETITFKVGYDNNNYPYFRVQDNGMGMNQNDLAHIFERFYRSDVARNKGTGGTGLGLSIAKWIIDKHKGDINVVSRPDIGTRFTITLK